MKAILQYASAVDGPYKNCGVVRPKRNQDYKVSRITEDTRLGLPELIGYEVSVTALAIELNTDFLDDSTWYFRLVFPSELEMILLGSRPYFLDFDGLIQRNEILYHSIQLIFFIGISDYSDYTDPIPLPESEGGLVLDDSAIYIE